MEKVDVDDLQFVKILKGKYKGYTAEVDDTVTDKTVTAVIHDLPYPHWAYLRVSSLEPISEEALFASRNNKPLFPEGV